MELFLPEVDFKNNCVVRAKINRSKNGVNGMTW